LVMVEIFYPSNMRLSQICLIECQVHQSRIAQTNEIDQFEFTKKKK
jgi:hypothetical protein